MLRFVSLFAFVAVSALSHQAHAGGGYLAALAFASPLALPSRPGMPDPRNMSGIPRPDPSIPVGTVTVRCLLGSFAEPALDSTVRLTIFPTEGKEQSREAQTVAKGRATFAGLESFIGAQAIAEVTLGGELHRSQPFMIQSNSGTALMLVKGAGTRVGGDENAEESKIANDSTEAGTPPSSAHGTTSAHDAVPPLGEAFVLEGRDPGTLVVGALDLSSGGSGVKPLVGVEVRLFVQVPAADSDAVKKEEKDGKVEEKLLKRTVDAEGRATFEGLLPPEYPPETRFRVEANLQEGAPAVVSKSFKMEAKAKAIILTPKSPGMPGTHGDKGKKTSTAAARPMPEMPPRSDASLPLGTVRVQVTGFRGQAFSPPNAKSTEVTLSRHSMTGEVVSWTEAVNSKGQAEFKGITGKEGSLFQATTKREGAPYGSRFFALPASGGAIVELRTYSVSADPSSVRSAVHYEVAPLENDLSRVSQIYMAMVDGEQAFWPGSDSDWKIELPEGARSLRVLPDSTAFLETPGEQAPYAVLSGPLPPGQEIRLSIAYLMPHNGSIDLQWDAPFPLLGGQMSVAPGLKIVEGVEADAIESPHGGAAQVFNLQKQGERGIKFSVTELPTSNRIFVWIAIGLIAVALLLTAFGVLFSGRESLHQSLIRRRDELLQRVKSEAAESVATRESDLEQLNQIYHQLDAFESSSSPGATRPVS